MLFVFLHSVYVDRRRPQKLQWPRQVHALQPKHARINLDSARQDTGGNVHSDMYTYALQVAEETVVQPLGRCVPLSIRKGASGLLVSAIIRSIEGDIVGRLQDNKWVSNPSDYFRINYDTSTLEVIGEYDVPLLQIEYLDGSTVTICGVFCVEEDEISEIYPDFPTMPKNLNLRPVTRQRGVVLLLQKTRGYMTFQYEPGSYPYDLLRNTFLKTLFDYSNPRRLGVRKQEQN